MTIFSRNQKVSFRASVTLLHQQDDELERNRRKKVKEREEEMKMIRKTRICTLVFSFLLFRVPSFVPFCPVGIKEYLLRAKRKRTQVDEEEEERNREGGKRKARE